MSRGRAQAWSIDLVIGVLVFLLVIGIVYVMLRAHTENDTTELKVSSEVIAMKLVNDPGLSIIENGAVVDARMKGVLDRIKAGGYETLKQDLGVRNEFCIFFEDANGNVITLHDTDGGKYTGIGPASEDLNISGTPCGAPTG